MRVKATPAKVKATPAKVKATPAKVKATPAMEKVEARVRDLARPASAVVLLAVKDLASLASAAVLAVKDLASLASAAVLAVKDLARLANVGLRKATPAKATPVTIAVKSMTMSVIQEAEVAKLANVVAAAAKVGMIAITCV